MTSKPRFLTERLSVVCTWSGLTPVQEASPNLFQQVPDLLRSDQELLMTAAEAEQSNIVDI
jgi:hypothetical protein